MAPAGIDGGDEAVHKASRPKSSSQVTLCWRKADSNHWSPSGVRCQVADLHVLDHATAKWAHRQLLRETTSATGRRRIVSQWCCQTRGTCRTVAANKPIKLKIRSSNQCTTAQRFSTTSLSLRTFVVESRAHDTPRRPAAVIEPIAPPALAPRPDTYIAPTLITDAGGEHAGWRYVEFFTANISNDHTRRAYARACRRFFAWCENRGFSLTTIRLRCRGMGERIAG